MATKVFISWSGDLSRKLAQAVYDWLPGALQYVKPYFLPEDIEKGAKWDTLPLVLNGKLWQKMKRSLNE
ncbi:hypothetical protein KAR91_25100 [Candidatus Pacearchaeota archaeon]|nr:hypothetical protein [Candidatus Pacearchaeota archaeon]